MARWVWWPKCKIGSPSDLQLQAAAKPDVDTFQGPAAGLSIRARGAGCHLAMGGLAAKRVQRGSWGRGLPLKPNLLGKGNDNDLKNACESRSVKNC